MSNNETPRNHAPMSIIVEGLGYVYMKKSPYEKRALDNVSFSVAEGDFISVVGQTGSGKSTMLQHLNGLIKLTEGRIQVGDIDLTVRRPDYKRLRYTVGMVFQYPEYQLFDDTVAKDVGFGCRNAGLPPEEIDQRVREALTLVGLDYEDVCDRSPFELSGGQKRRVAIAGVVAMRPQVLVLDEPTAGLDPKGRREIMDMVVNLQRTMCPTVLMVSHDMEAVAEYCNRVLVLAGGKLIYDLTPQALFAKGEELRALGLDTPVAVQVAERLRQKGWDIPPVLTPQQLADAIGKLMEDRA